MATRVQFHGVAETVRRLRNLPKELSGLRGGPVRKALFEAAGVMQTEAKAMAPTDPETETDIPSAIFRRRSTNPRAQEGSPAELYRVGWDTKRLPYGHIVELGSSKWAGHPFMRPAFESKKDEAATVYANVLGREVDKIERKLAKSVPK